MAQKDLNSAAAVTLPADSRAELEAKLRAEIEAQVRAEIKAEQAAAAEPAQPTSIDGFGFPKEYERITVFEGGETDALGYVPVQVNGYPIQITRGEAVLVNKVVGDALDAAREAKPVKTQGGLVTREVHRFPFQRAGRATEAEYLAFKANSKAVQPVNAVQTH